MKLPHYLCLSGLALLSTGLTAQKIEFQEYDLKNGLHVILHEDHTTPIVTVSVLYHVGSKNEDPKRTGFAHFFEHLMFEGSANIGRGEYGKIIEENGGVLNANTSFDRTFYFEILPANQLELGLWMEAERMLHLKVDSVGVETQRGVVKEELNLRVLNQPYGSILQETFSHAFKTHPYRWTPIGDAQYINAATYEEFMDFYKTFYVPNNATVSIAGDINVEQTKKWIEKYFGSIPKGTKTIPRPKEIEPKQTVEVRDTVYDNIQLPAVVMGYHIPGQGTPDYYAVNMLAQLLSQGESSRITKNVVDKQQKAIFAGAFPLPTEDPGLALMFGICNMGIQPDDLEKSIEAEVEKVQKELISDEEFQKLKNQIEAEFVTKNTSMAGIAENLANYEVYFGDANLINTEIERYMKVTKEDIQRVAKEYFRKENRVVLYYLPKK